MARLLRVSLISPLVFCLTVGAVQAQSLSSSEPVSAETTETRAQTTTVQQLSDIQPGDWAYQALQSLRERYGCAAGYPDGRFLGGRSLSREEFAAGLNACLEKIAAVTAPQSDLQILQLLSQEFQAELSIQRQSVEARVEDRTDLLEALQFSTTTKLKGEVMINVGGITAGRDVSPYGNYERLQRWDAQSRSILRALPARLGPGR
jgi:hypothetical protein